MTVSSIVPALAAIVPPRDFGILVLETAAWALLGLLLFGFAFWILTKITPFSIRKEIEQDHNVAMAVVIAAILLGVAMIVAAAISG